MIRFGLAALIALTSIPTQAQLASKLDIAWRKFTSDPQMKYGLAGICVLDAKTGKLLFEKNSNIGLAPASTQKVLTSIAAFEALGANYQYQTRIGYTGHIENRKLRGDIVIEKTGDPSFGSWRYAATQPEQVLNQITNAVKQWQIDSVSGGLTVAGKSFELNPIPDNWTWGDMGNYYGAGHWGLNWNENQFDLYLKTGNRPGDATQIADSDPSDIGADIFINDTKTGKAGTGDGSIIYMPPYAQTAFIGGKLEPGKARFKVSGAMPNAELNALNMIQQALSSQLAIAALPKPSLYYTTHGAAAPHKVEWKSSIASPTLDSIVYWFMQKSINLYGEALLRTIGAEKKGYGSTETGLEWIEQFYASNGFDTDALHMMDGSGLSPTNRITPLAMSKALLLAKRKSWYPAFHASLPLYNGMKLKSGTIHRVKCFAGYHGNYIVTLMVNNYNGPVSSIVNKMFGLLDNLK